MTLIDIYLTLPMWAKIIVAVISFVWAVELFLMPFSFNLMRNTLKEQNDLLRQILASTKLNREDSDNTRKLLTLLMDLMLPKKKNNDKEEL